MRTIACRGGKNKPKKSTEANTGLSGPSTSHPSGSGLGAEARKPESKLEVDSGTQTSRSQKAERNKKNEMVGMLTEV